MGQPNPALFLGGFEWKLSLGFLASR